MEKPTRGDEFHRLRAIETDDCVIWPYSTNSGGYGTVRLAGKSVIAHRQALILATGIDPAGLEAAHGPCHQPACMNPRHLSWKSRSENQKDRVRDGTDANGERCSMAKLTEIDVIAIRASTERQRTVAARFGISQSTVSKIKAGKLWT